MLMYIRHSDDDRSPKTYKHDKSIDDLGKKRTKSQTRKWLRKYGVPDVLFCSPFRRTFETAKIIRDTCYHSTGVKVPLYIDPNLSRYFCSSEQENPSVNPKTYEYDIPIYECKFSFQERIEKHLDFVNVYHKNPKIENIWCITHALVYKHVAKLYNIRIPTTIPFLHAFTLYKQKK
jgi:broad specificity phosphatase PhoE